jgi:ubiquitin C-terminal hydrolase
MDKYFATEVMEGDEKWVSPTAGKVDAVRATRVWKLPEVFIISLKRFTMTGTKINTKISFPLEGLDMKKYLIGPEVSYDDSVYNLVGCVLHMGMLFGGHYVAVVRNPGGSWVFCNDSSVRRVRPEEFHDAAKDACYTLVYQKRSLMLKDDHLERISD